jgi:hypothetical protein
MKFILSVLVLVLLAQTSGAQTATINGTVKDALTKEGLFGATVVIDGTQKGANVGMDGRFRLEIPAGKNLNLIFRNLGYSRKEVPLKPIPAGEIRTLSILME